jgi:long-chain acyl-CoA synthetase
MKRDEYMAKARAEPNLQADAEIQPYTENPQECTTSLISYPWIRHYEQGVPAHVAIPDQPLTWFLEDTARRYPDFPACDYYGTTLTYAQLLQFAHRFARALEHLGVQKGDRVAISLPNIPQYPIAFYGALEAGAVVVPTNPLYTEGELQHQLVDAGAKIIVMLDMYYPNVRAIRAQTVLEHIILTSPADFLPPVLRVLYPPSQRRDKHPAPHLTRHELHHDPMLHTMHTLMDAFSENEAAPAHPPVQASDLAVLQYTGGTTGLAKGAMLTHSNLVANVLQTRAWFAQAREGEEVMLCAAPFFHSYGLTVCMNLSLLIAAKMVLLPRFKAKDVVKTIRRTHPTLFPGIPTMYLAIMREANKHPEQLKSIRYCISGAAPLPAKVQADFEAMTGGKLVEGYGLSEAGPVTHCNPLNGQARSGTIGLPFPDVDAAIVDAQTGESVPTGEVGELVVRGPNIMQGYWKREEETRLVLQNGWLHTGDLGRMDAHGYFSIVERIKDVIIASGYKVFPREVEEVLFQHSAVAEAAVVGAPDAYRGETVVAFIVLKEGIEASEQTRQELLAYCQQRLAVFKAPKILEFRTSLPKSLIGKVIRRELRGEVTV